MWRYTAILSGCIAYAALAPYVAGADDFLPPSDNDLKATYCFAVDQQVIAFESESLSAYSGSGNPKIQEALKEQRAQIDKLNRDIARLRAYEAERSLDLDPAPLLIAYQRGKSDFKQLMDYAGNPQSAFNVCISKQAVACARVAKDKQIQCMQSAIDQCQKVAPPPVIAEIQASVKRCRDLSWLPY